MCIKSKHHGCLQGTLIFLCTICVLLFGFMVVWHLTVFYLTESSSLLGPQPIASSLIDRNDDVQDRMLSSQNQANALEQLRRRRRQQDSATISPPQQEIGEQLANYLFVRDCSINQYIVQSAILIDVCPGQIDSLQSITDQQFINCLHESYFYIGLASLLPFCLVLITLIAVCRLWLCPMITLALIYLALAFALMLAAILYKSGAILTDGFPLFCLIIGLVCLYALLSLLLILLFSLVTCERRKNSNGQDSDKIIKMSDDDDEVDDPNVPLYKNGLYSPQKRTDFDDKIKDFKYIDDDMSYVFRRG